MGEYLLIVNGEIKATGTLKMVRNWEWWWTQCYPGDAVRIEGPELLATNHSEEDWGSFAQECEKSL